MELLNDIQAALGSRGVRTIEPWSRAHAAVAVVLAETGAGLEVLFIERALNDDDLWSGHVGFPGGRAEERDRGARETAERETREELGLDLSAARYLGRLGDIAPGGLAMVVSCFVYGVGQPPDLHPDRREVARAFWFPLRALADPERRTHVDLLFRGRARRFPAVSLGNGIHRPLWGISYRLLRNLCRAMIRPVFPAPPPARR